MLSFSANAAGVELPYFRGFENDTVGEPLNDPGCAGLYVPDWHSKNCTDFVSDKYPARYGKNYLSLECYYDPSMSMDDARRIDFIFEGAWSPSSKCHVMRTDDGTEYWIGWSLYIPEDYEAEYWSHSVMQVIDQANNVVVFNMYYGGGVDDEHGRTRWGGRHDWGTGKTYPTYDESWIDDKGKWTDWVFHVVWYGSDNSSARFELYQNGSLVYSRNSKQNMPANGAPILTPVQLYNTLYYTSLYDQNTVIKNNDIKFKRGVYFDEFRLYEGKLGEYGYSNAAPPIQPSKPQLVYPKQNATDVPLEVNVSYSAPEDSRVDPQNSFSYSATQIQIDSANGNWTSLVYDSGPVSDKTNHIVKNLANSTQYKIRVRHQSARKNSSDVYWSDWSDPVLFTTISGEETDATKIPPPFLRLK